VAKASASLTGGSSLLAVYFLAAFFLVALRALVVVVVFLAFAVFFLAGAFGGMLSLPCRVVASAGARCCCLMQL